MFMRAYQDMVFRPLRASRATMRRREDIAQEMFIKAYENFAHLRESPTAGGWLKTVATNLSLNYLTRYATLAPVLRSGARARRAAARHGRRLAERGEERALLEEALRGLPPHQRVPLVLYHFEDLSYEDIAARLGISLAKVKTDIRRARVALAPVLERRGMAVTGKVSRHEPEHRSSGPRTGLEQALRSLPLRRRPPPWKAGCCDESARRAALPWWQRGFAQWPAPARDRIRLGLPRADRAPGLGAVGDRRFGTSGISRSMWVPLLREASVCFVLAKTLNIIGRAAPAVELGRARV